MSKPGAPTTTSGLANEPASEAERAKVKAERGLIVSILNNSMTDFDQIMTQSGNIINVNMESSGKMTPLHTAAAHGRRDMCEKLLAKKANVNPKNGLGFTPLTNAVLNGNEACVSLLLKAGAEKNVTTIKGDTPLSLAQARGYNNLVDLLK